jgi:hypothetical protein
MKKTLPLLFVVLMALSITGCGVMKVFAETVEGSGEVIVEQRDLPVYNSIEAHGDIELYVTQLNTGVEVHAESNLIKYVRTYVEDQTLIVEIADTDGGDINLKPLEPIRVYVKLVRIKDVSLYDGVILTSSQLVADGGEINVSLTGESWGYVNAIRTGTLHVSLSEGSELQVIDGQVTEQYVSASGESIYAADWLRSETTEIQLSDNSEATIWAEDTFNVNLSGGSMAYYYGSPVNLNEVRSTGDSDYISRGEH